MKQSDFYAQLVNYLLNAPEKDGKYTIDSEKILEMAKEELIKRGEFIEKDTFQNDQNSDFRIQLTDYFHRNSQKKSPTNYWYLLNSESILEIAKKELLKRGIIMEKKSGETLSKKVDDEN